MSHQPNDVPHPHVRIGGLDIVGFGAAGLGLLVRGAPGLAADHVPPAGHRTPESFAGVCVASSPDPACDEYVLAQLRAMGVRHVRVDYTYGSENRHTTRFLEFLLDHSIEVLLHLFQPLEEGRAMNTPAAQERWRAFVETALDRWGRRVEAVEIGTTVNRRKWAGYTPNTFMRAWRIAHEAARRRSVTLAGPNVTDFEPIYNVMLLSRMKGAGLLPDVHTNNLFVERAREPERYDSKVLGRPSAPLVKFNLIKKARLLQRIAESFELRETWSTHVAWSKRRIDRVLPNVEQKQADYLARYMILAAASGALSRVYWGLLIGQREGIIDDGTNEYPEPIPHVARYEHVYGDVSDYRARPALDAMRTFTELIPGARYEGRQTRTYGLEIHAFSRPEGTIHAIWTTDGRGADPASIYEPHDLADAQWISRDGERLADTPTMVTESPRYVRWPAGRAAAVTPDAGPVPQLVVHQPLYLHRGGGWRGVVRAASEEERDTLLDGLAPERLNDLERRAVLRDSRNTLWTIADPRNERESLVVKRWRLRSWHKRILDRFKPSKARRSWNGACELLRRGIDTPTPVAFFERDRRAVLRENFYICAYIPGGLTVRRFFSAYRQGDEIYEGIPEDSFYHQLADFLVNMHRRGVHYRDLAPGNILVEKRDNSAIRFLLVDTARARFFDHAATVRQRLSDLKRTSHALDWRRRREFVGIYLQRWGEEFTPRRELPFRVFDAQQRIKQWRKRQQRRLLGRSGKSARTIARSLGFLVCLGQANDLAAFIGMT